jgi:hypothetical protein
LFEKVPFLSIAQFFIHKGTFFVYNILVAGKIPERGVKTFNFWCPWGHKIPPTMGWRAANISNKPAIFQKL